MPSAAARVFGIAELLESILIQVAHIEVTHLTERDRCFKLTSKAATQLFRLQRVDRNFNQNIKHSKKLARLMFLAEDAPGTSELPPTSRHPETDELNMRFAPMLWLLNDLTQNTDAFDCLIVSIKDNTERTTCDIWGKVAVFRERSRSHYVTSRQDFGASWRAMRVSTVPDAEQSTVSFKVWTFPGHMLQENREHEQTEWYKLEGRETLGDFFDSNKQTYEPSHHHGSYSGVLRARGKTFASLHRIKAGHWLTSRAILEEILVCVATQATVEAAEYSVQSSDTDQNWWYKSEPAATLAILSGIDRTFYATIKGSHKLQRMAKGDRSCMLGLSDPCAALPMQWLVEHTLGIRGRGGCPEITHVSTNYDRGLKRNKLNNFANREGKHYQISWRQVKIYQEPASRTLTISTKFRRTKGYKGANHYWDKVEVGAGVTLGTLFQHISSAMTRSTIGHVFRVQRLEAEAKNARLEAEAKNAS